VFAERPRVFHIELACVWGHVRDYPALPKFRKGIDGTPDHPRRDDLGAPLSRVIVEHVSYEDFTRITRPGSAPSGAEPFGKKRFAAVDSEPA
jgi:hypothetical protein